MWRERAAEFVNNIHYDEELKRGTHGAVYIQFERLGSDLLSFNLSYDDFRQRSDAIIDFALTRLYSTTTEENAPWRQMLIDTSIMRALARLFESERKTVDDVADWRESIWTLDTANIISGCPGKGRRQQVESIIYELQQRTISTIEQSRLKDISIAPTSDSVLGKRKRTEESTGEWQWEQSVQIPVLKEIPTLDQFMTMISNDAVEPFIIPKEATAEWPCFNERAWTDLNHILQIGCNRVVPVEIGSKYTEDSWSQKLVNFEDFLEACLEQSGHAIPEPSAGPLHGQKVYLAQHNLLEQMPRLKKDILIPDYCYVHYDLHGDVLDEDGDGVILNAWFGPSGTISPLHQDPYHNLFTQVVGRKRMVLFSPKDTPYLYPHESFMSNTSQVDIDREDQEKFPLFTKAKCYKCNLQPGEMLYVPPNWWHFVQSLELSFSLSFWFT